MTGKTITIYTTGDNRNIKGGQKILHDGKLKIISMSAMWKLRATSLASAGSTFKADNLTKLIQVFGTIQADSVSTIYFVGHGFDNSEGGYFLSGAPEGSDNFTASSNQCINLAEKELMNKLVAAIYKIMKKESKVTIGFLSCYTGNGKMTRWFYNKLFEAGLKQLTVGAYKDYYQTRFTANKQGRILRWTDNIVNKQGNEVVRTGVNGIPNYQVIHKIIDSRDPLEGLEFN